MKYDQVGKPKNDLLYTFHLEVPAESQRNH